MGPRFDTFCYDLRAEVLSIQERIRKGNEGDYFDEGNPGFDKFEMAANLMLAFRHLEDARMRLGKAIQAFDGGASVYPR